MKKEKNKFLKEVARFMRSPHVRKASRMATSLVELWPTLVSKNPIMMGMGLTSFIDQALEAWEIPMPSRWQEYALKHDLKYAESQFPKLLVSAGVDKDFEINTMFKENGWEIKELDLDGESLYFIENYEIKTDDRVENIGALMYYTKDFNFEYLMSKIWLEYDQGALLATRSADGKKVVSHGHQLRLFPLTNKGYKYIGDLDFNNLAKDAASMTAKGMSRSYILAGMPGTGKSSFVYEFAKNFDNKILKIDPSVASLLTGNDLDLLLCHLKPRVLLLDDFDRAATAQTTMNLLFLIENMKQRFPEMIIFATVNDFESMDKALVRPGRFDKIIWFEAPDDDIRREIAREYLSQFEAEFSEELIEEIVEGTDGLSPVYIKELCSRLANSGEEISEILEEFERVNDLSDHMGGPFISEDMLGGLDGSEFTEEEIMSILAEEGGSWDED